MPMVFALDGLYFVAAHGEDTAVAEDCKRSRVSRQQLRPSGGQLLARATRHEVNSSSELGNFWNRCSSGTLMISS